MFRNLEIKVNLINNRDRLLDFLDEEIVDALSYHLRERGVIVRHRESCERSGILRRWGRSTSEIRQAQLKTDVLLWAAGRTGNSDHLGLDICGHHTRPGRGNIPVNGNLQTAAPHVYAVGDVIGPPALASAAYNQGRYAASHFLCESGDGESCGPAASLDIPAGDLHEPGNQLARQDRTGIDGTIGLPHEVGHAHFKSIARAQITGQTTGMLKILFHRETLEILGIHCFGANATEIIHISHTG